MEKDPTVATIFPDRNYVNRNVTLFCSAGSDADSFTWRVNKSAAMIFYIVHYAYPQVQDASVQESRFNDFTAVGTFVEPYMYNHSLTLVDVPEEYHNSEWRCTVTSPTCFLGVDWDLTLLLKGT